MKKSKIWLALVALFVVLVGAGCSNQSSSSNSSNDYSTLMKQGKDYVADAKYSQAESKFEAAHKVKATTESKVYADQADDMSDAKDDISEYDFGDALESLNKVIYANNGYSVMTNRAKKQYKTISRVQSNIKNEINPLYKNARNAYNNGNYQQAEQYCTQILDLPYINGKYYKQIRNKVSDLLNDAKDANNYSDSNSSSNKTNSNNNSDKDDNDADDAQSSSSNNSSSSNQSSSNFNNMTVGGQAVPARVIAQVRDKLSSMGVSTSSWSDQDVVNFMNSTAQNGHTTIDSYTQSDVNNFNK